MDILSGSRDSDIYNIINNQIRLFNNIALCRLSLTNFLVRLTTNIFGSSKVNPERPRVFFYRLWTYEEPRRKLIISSAVFLLIPIVFSLVAS